MSAAPRVDLPSRPTCGQSAHVSTAERPTAPRRDQRIFVSVSRHDRERLEGIARAREQTLSACIRDLISDAAKRAPQST